jgi:hypothetical protein
VEEKCRRQGIGTHDRGTDRNHIRHRAGLCP